MARQKKAPAWRKGHSSTGKLSKVNYNLATHLCKLVLYLLLAAIYVPLYCALIIGLPLLPTRLANRLIDWLAAEQEGI